LGICAVVLSETQ